VAGSDWWVGQGPATPPPGPDPDPPVFNNFILNIDVPIVPIVPIVQNDPGGVPVRNVPNINNHRILSDLSFSIQNVRSMNVSTKNEITTQKIIAICNLKSDFIFLSQNPNFLKI